MVINVIQVLKNLSGQTMMDTDGQGNAVEATLRMAIVNALLAPVQKEDGMEKIKKYRESKSNYRKQ